MFNKEMRNIKRAQGKMPTQTLNVGAMIYACHLMHVYMYNFV